MSTLTENKIPVVLTPNAVREVKDLLSKGNYGEGYGLRLGVKVAVVPDSATY